MKKITILFLFLLIFVLGYQSVSAETQSTCLNLNINLKQGMKDKNSETNIYTLQVFLKSKNYLTANPNGFFGQQTFKAVKKFQKDNGVSPTGNIGPLTRTLIEKLSCVINTPVVENVPDTNSNTTTNTPPIVPETPVVDETLLPPSNISSLRVRTDGVVSVTKDSLVLRGTVTAGARSGTESWFELTTNPTVYKVSETKISTKAPRKSNYKFENTLGGLESDTMYYFRACAGNVDLGQRTCGNTGSIKTSTL